MKAIIVDDEPKAIELLTTYLKHFNSIELAATFRNGLKAFEYISEKPVDLIFLDINMPHISGISLSKMLPKSVNVIFTTAYSEFAVESYEVRTLDYLMKPITLERFTKAISKVLEVSQASSKSEQTIILLKSGFETFRVSSETILYLEKEGNYMTYHCENQKILARETIAEALQKLPDCFVQTHKSYIINIEKVVSFDKEEINMGDRKVPMGVRYKTNVMHLIIDHGG